MPECICILYIWMTTVLQYIYMYMQPHSPTPIPVTQVILAHLILVSMYPKIPGSTPDFVLTTFGIAFKNN